MSHSPNCQYIFNDCEANYDGNCNENYDVCVSDCGPQSSKSDNNQQLSREESSSSAVADNTGKICQWNEECGAGYGCEGASSYYDDEMGYDVAVPGICQKVGACDQSCGTCGWKDANGQCQSGARTDGSWCCHRACSATQNGVCDTVFGEGANTCEYDQASKCVAKYTISSVVSCPGGTVCDGTPVTGTDGQVVCGTDLNDWTCTAQGWTTKGEKCVCPNVKNVVNVTNTSTSSSSSVGSSYPSANVSKSVNTTNSSNSSNYY